MASNDSTSQTMSSDIIISETRFLLTQLRQFAQISGDFRTVYAREASREIKGPPLVVSLHTYMHTPISIHLNSLLKFLRACHHLQEVIIRPTIPSISMPVMEA